MQFILDHLSKVSANNENFALHPRIEKLLQYRQRAMEGKTGIDWALAEHVAFASFVLAGKHVRLSGQDCERGTFNQRHSVIFCCETGRGVNKINEMVTSIAMYTHHRREKAVLRGLLQPILLYPNTLF
jgi:2-oxoglutarate dehydrogenase E1 component